ncbi:hypothetical protein J3R30DRAFT_3295438 [Lentinula aciculospora]|uniref:NYN domain-containing protein n=1 Tax=Lentinula aciculospora TaxID=153920 RepID=A0A9W9A638_9AGAR|nr:hypothetical protein J3R30DRAFT_3295438 [Lentinula aciculospora]
MIRSNSDTTTASTSSPTPVSPFSSDYSVPSEPTSDETPDLGAFTAVLRAWTNFQPPPRTFNSTLAQQANTSSSSRSLATTSSSDLREDKSTVWSHRPIANYLSLSDPVTTDAESTDRDRPRTVQIEAVEDELDNLYDFDDTNDDNDHDDSDEQLRVQDLGLHDVEEQPSLGYLDEALKFIAAERERLTSQREIDAAAAVLTGIDSRRKRRRKRNKTPPEDLDDADDVDALGVDADDSSSSVEQQLSPLQAKSVGLFSSTPGTPSRKARGRGRIRLLHSRSTPQLRLIQHEEDDDSPRVQQLRQLGKKLEALFPEDREYLKKNTSKNVVLGGFVDTRGDPPKKTVKNDERLIHVFVDHSNILIGLLNYLRRYPRQHPHSSPYTSSSPYPKPPKHLSHSALSLILERGRPVTRRILVTSSPLYQPMDGAESLGFEVRIFARVPDTGEGMDREKSNNFGNGKQNYHKKSKIEKKKVHSRKMSGNSSAESEQNVITGGISPGFMRNSAHLYSYSLPTSHTSTPPPFLNPNATSSLAPPAVITPSPAQQQRIRYREQGVDELLQLKLHQVLASIEGPPPKGSTIILATGDGNVGQFNEDGFLGGVRTALRRGWKVELYAWEGGLSRAWKREFGEGNDDGPRFKVVGIEQFGSELVEIYY